MIGLLATLQVQGAHSVLSPASPQARTIDRLWDFMYVVSIVVFIAVVGALLWAVLHRRPENQPALESGLDTRMKLPVIAATGVTVAILFGFLVYDFEVGRAISAPPDGALPVRVTGHQWWWEVQYPDSVPQNNVTTANEIHIPVGRAVVFELLSTDVIHSFWPPNLMGKRDNIPGHHGNLWFQADTPGVYRGMCAEFCGHQHAKMGFLLIADPPDVFHQWLAQQRDTAKTPTDSLTARGLEVFLATTCVMCHAISGTPAGSRVGPDLTHLASRRTIAAGTLANTPGNLAAWITDPQSIKPGSKMPPNRLSGPDMHALLAYLGALK